MPRMRTYALITWLATVVSAYGSPAAEIAKKAFASTVLIVVEDDHGQPVSLGSGFVLRDHAIVTNLHVIAGASQGYAKQIDSKTKHRLEGILHADSGHDLAVLAVPSLSAPALPIGDSSKLAVGDTIYAVGNPRGLEGTFSEGVVSSIRNIDSQVILQITAPISPGSSGGAVLNERGEVVGVAVATFKDGQNLNFAIPSSYLARIKLATSPSPLTTAPKRTASAPLPGEREGESWNYPIHLGDPISKVHSLLGTPSRTTEVLEEYPRSGVSVWFTPEGRVAKLNFQGQAGALYAPDNQWHPTDRIVLLGLSPRATEIDFAQALGTPDETKLERGSKFREAHLTWRRDGYIVDAWFLAIERSLGDIQFPKGALLWFEVSPTL